MKVAFASLGCSKNLVDSENMLGALREAGYEIEAREEEADVIVVNTCCFIESAREESVGVIADLARNKAGACRALVVTGCMATRYKQDILQQFPEVDVVAGVGSDIVGAVEKALSGRREVILEPGHAYSSGRVRTTQPHTAYIKIADGCDNCCTYCVIPSIRGRYKSRPIEEILEEVHSLVQDGVREIILIAQDTTAYGVDLYGEVRLPELLREICRLDAPKLRWIRLLYCYPERIADELIDVIAQEDKICKYIDMPIQHCNDSILRKMGRRGDCGELVRLITKLRERIPGVVLRTTLIVGFPGESAAKFQELLEFVDEAGFERLGVFEYSREEGTPAAKMKGQISKKEKHTRQREVLDLQSAVAEDWGQSMIGRTVEVLVEGYEDETGYWYGRWQGDSVEIDGRVIFESEMECKVGDFTEVLIEDSIGYDLVGIVGERREKA